MAQGIHSSEGLAHDKQYLELKKDSNKKTQDNSRFHRHAIERKQRHIRARQVYEDINA